MVDVRPTPEGDDEHQAIRRYVIVNDDATETSRSIMIEGDHPWRIQSYDEGTPELHQGRSVTHRQQ
jgi:hypothetical protein